MKNRIAFTVLCLAGFSALALFGSTDVPDGDPLITLLNLILNFKASGPLVIAASIVTIIVQGVKKFAPTFPYSKGVAVFGGVIYGIFQALQSGLGLVESLVFVLVTSGGAVAIYEYLKNPLNAVFQVKK